MTSLRIFVSAMLGASLLAASPVLADDELFDAVEALPSGPEGPALWKVSDEDTTIYLFGTVHVLPKELVWYDAEIDAALNASDTIVTEIAMDPATEAKQQMLAQQKGVFTDGTTLRSLLSEEQKAAYEAALANLGAPANAFDPLEPWLTTLTLTFIPLMQQGYDPNSGVEKVIMSKAGEQSLSALETIEFQLDMFDTMPMDKQVTFMMEAVEAMPEVKATLDSMVARWAEGDAEGLAALMNDDLSDPLLADTLLYSRNENWADWIEDRLESTPGTVFMAVGAGHLAGEKSVQDYLEAKGIQSARIQ
ncbi:TraB/GumN family protein [Erythrobacter sp. SCSIO 43205]|uniref:TraB/GumN family protein n=1 Tax=Erythrobacter sp. SCSIO 43205 TaxID=2779361 RepID=UPI001CA8D986|nr:TraB/GumN family protein [Erythrobacter sp. SCSIO 43205]UAB77113.1 TraB/GumN family protein [Erythrobacter sp. SCSIO 43205]